MSLTPVDEEQSTGSDFAPKHAHCMTCFPPEKFGPGSRVLAMCGEVKEITEEFDPEKINKVPDNACVVCADPAVGLQHMLKRHYMV